MKKKIKIENMSCVNCAKTIEKHISKLQGVENIKVSFALKQAEIEFNEFILKEEEIEKEIENLGYRVRKNLGDRISEIHILLLSILGAVFFLINMFLTFPYELQFVVATLIQFIGGYGFYMRAYKSLKENVGNMDVLIAVGTTGAYIYSLLAFLNIIEGKPFFETPVFIIAFVRLGKFIEEQTKNRALKGLFNLVHLSMNEIKVIKDGKVFLTDISEVKKGDTVELKGGELSPVDGTIIEGDCYVDESMLTGESTPIYKNKGDKIISGSIIDSGRILLKVEKPFKESYAFNLSRVVSEALSQKPKVQLMADKISAYFVEAVIIISILTFITWLLLTGDFYKSIQFSLAVLVVSCPCALGIATPLAITAGVNRMLKKGIAVRNLTLFERIPHVEIYIFDKTGTLTEGKMKVEKVETFHENACSIAFALESKSNHPVARAIYEYCKNKVKTVPEFKDCREIKGMGVECGEFIATKASFWGVESKNGFTVVGIGKRDKLFALFYIRDKIRRESKEVISFLKKRRKRVILLTGDSENTANMIAKELDIEEVHANAKPEDKLKLVKYLQERGLRIAMVGDGINDAPALAQAYVSLAIGEGTDMAKRVGDAILIEGVKAIPFLIKESEKTLKRIKQNLFWAFIYNSLSIPIASGVLSWAGVFIKPEIAGAMMALSSLSVAINSIRK